MQTNATVLDDIRYSPLTVGEGAVMDGNLKTISQIARNQVVASTMRTSPHETASAFITKFENNFGLLSPRCSLLFMWSWGIPGAILCTTTGTSQWMQVIVKVREFMM